MESGGFEFPCEIPIKAMGRGDEGFQDEVVRCVAEHVEVDPAQVRCRDSSEGRFCSITVTAQVESREQLEAIYRSLRECEQVLFTL